MTDHKPTYDTFTSKNAAIRDAIKRNREAKANGSGRAYSIKRTGNKRNGAMDNWTVVYRETK